MATIKSNAKVFVYADQPIKTIEGGAAGIDEQPIPNRFGNTQNYYGETSGAAAQPIEKLWQPSSYMGVTTGKTTIFNETLYYQVAIKVTFRESNGWNAGTYTDNVDRLCWCSSEYLTDSEDTALEKFNKRTDKATKKEVQDANKSGKSDIAPVTGSTITETLKSNSTTIFSILGLFALSVIGYLLLRKK